MSTGGPGRWDEDIDWSPSTGRPGRARPEPGRSAEPGRPEPGPDPEPPRRAAGPPRPTQRPSRPGQAAPARTAPSARLVLIGAAIGAFLAGGVVGYVIRGNPPVPSPQSLQQTLPVVTVTVEADQSP